MEKWEFGKRGKGVEVSIGDRQKLYFETSLFCPCSFKASGNNRTYFVSIQVPNGPKFCYLLCWHQFAKLYAVENVLISLRDNSKIKQTCLDSRAHLERGEIYKVESHHVKKLKRRKKNFFLSHFLSQLWLLYSGTAKDYFFPLERERGEHY